MIALLAFMMALLPNPTEYTTTGHSLSFGAVRFEDVSAVSSDVVKAAFGRVERLLKLSPTDPWVADRATSAGADLPRSRAATELVMRVKVASDVASPMPTMDTNENYTLSINASGAFLVATTAFGALRGLETFSQLASCSSTGCSAPSANVRDSPRFPYRGLLVDVARRFLPVPLLHAVIDSMAYAKLNVLHIHATDDQSWPLALSTYPELALRGAFSPSHTYTKLVLEGLVQYARLRGVRVIVEVPHTI